MPAKFVITKYPGISIVDSGEKLSANGLSIQSRAEHQCFLRRLAVCVVSAPGTEDGLLQCAAV